MIHLLLAAQLGAAGAVSPDVLAGAWEHTLERVVPAVVVLRVSSTRPFDTESRSTSVATGFVVDAERGIILSNRHVVSPGPVVAEAVFQNHEEVEVAALYRDPVHDFGFFGYDPRDVKFMPRAELQLAPHAARIGTEIRVVGNDAGEKLSILAGTLARTDRKAPFYGRGRYNDFNTFYLQAASNTSGGSSGSPVVDIRGRVVGLNAGGTSRAASSFYLPLERVVRALELLREGKPVPRGTLQATFAHRPFDELRRLGLRSQTEAAVRRAFPEAVGMLVVDDTVPGGPSHEVLEPGDILVAVDGRRLTEFLPLEESLDDRVGDEIEVQVQRGGERLSLRLPVVDLHAVTPSEYLEFGGGVLHELSYQKARHYALPVGGVYVASPGYALDRAGVPREAVITELGGEPTPTLAVFEALLSQLAHGERVPIRYFRLQEPHTAIVSVLRVDRRWHTMQRCRRDDARQLWPCTPSPEPPLVATPEPSTTQFPEAGDRRIRKLARSLVLVEFNVPYRIDGVQGDRFVGAGLVVDAERGLVVTDRDTLPISLGDATLTFAGSLQVPGEVVYLHPGHNLTMLAYDPSLVGETPVRSADLHARDLPPGDEVWLVALTPGHRFLSERVRISQAEPVNLPLPNPPRFRETNVELAEVTNPPSSVGGVLADGRGRVVAMWSSFSTEDGSHPDSFFAGLPVELVQEIVEPLREGRLPQWRSLDAELVPISLASARNRGLSNAAAAALEDHDPKRRQVLSVRRVTAWTPAAERLREGDLVLAVNGNPVTRAREVERAIQGGADGAGTVAELAIVRDGRELRLEVPTRIPDGRGTDRALVWAGALLQAPHPVLASQRGIPLEGVYASWTWYGTPAGRYGLRATRRIVEVDGVPTPGLDAFLAQVSGKPDRGSVRLKTLDLEGRVAVGTLKLDLQYWPTFELRRTALGWERLQAAAPSSAAGEGSTRSTMGRTLGSRDVHR